MSDTETLLDRTYECAFLPDTWPAVLEGIGTQGGATAALMFAAGAQFSGWRACSRAEPTARRFIEDGWVMRNRRTPELLARNHMGFLPDSAVFNDEQLAVDPMQVELLLPAGLGREVATLVRTPTGETVVLTLHRAFAAGAFTEPEVARLDALRPHVARAAFLAVRLRLERMRAAVDILESVGLAAAILAKDGVVLASNGLLDQMPHVKSGAFSRLQLRRPHAQRQFTESLAGLQATAQGRQLSMLLTSDDATPDAILHLVPLRREARDMMTGAVAVAVIGGLGTSPMPSADLLHGLFDLTAAEARVARGLMNQSVGDLAATSGLSVETIRTQLRSVMHKTGTRRQAALTVLLARIAAVAGGDG